MNKKKLLGLLLAVCMTVVMIPTMVFAEEDATPTAPDKTKVVTVGETDNTLDWVYKGSGGVLTLPMSEEITVASVTVEATGDSVANVQQNGKNIEMTVDPLKTAMHVTNIEDEFTLVITDTDGGVTKVTVTEWITVEFNVPSGGTAPGSVLVPVKNGECKVTLPEITEAVLGKKPSGKEYWDRVGDFGEGSLTVNGNEAVIKNLRTAIYFSIAEDDASGSGGSDSEGEILVDTEKNKNLGIVSSPSWEHGFLTWCTSDSEPLVLTLETAIPEGNTAILLDMRGLDDLSATPSGPMPLTISKDRMSITVPLSILKTLAAPSEYGLLILDEQEDVLALFDLQVIKDRVSLPDMTMEEGSATTPLEWIIVDGEEDEELDEEADAPDSSFAEELDQVLVNGEPIDPENYTVYEKGWQYGIIFKEEYLNSLAPGTYHLRMEIVSKFRDMTSFMPLNTVLTVSPKATTPDGTDGQQGGNGGTSGTTIKPAGTTDGTGKTQPNTGDNSRAELWLMLGGIAAAACIGMMARKRKVQ